MNTTEFVNSAYLIAQGKLPTFASGSTKWNKLVALANIKIDVWQNEPDVAWNSLYTPDFSIGTVSATNTFDLDDDIRIISKAFGDTVRIQHTDGSSSNYDVVAAEELDQYSYGVCAQVGRTLVFKKAFTADDSQFGGTIYVPSYGYADHLSADGDEVSVDNPQWLVLAVAAEYVRGDIVRQNQYPNLVAEANDLMEGMKQNNDAQRNEVTRPWRPLAQEW